MVLPATGASSESPGSLDPAPTAITMATDRTVTTVPATTVTTQKTTTKTTTSSTTKAAASTTKATTAPTTARTVAPTAAGASASAPSTVVAGPTVVPGTFTVPAGTGIFYVTSVGNVPVGADGVVQLVVDNGWSPLFGDTYIDVSWDPSLVDYQSSKIKVLNTTAAISSDRSVRIMLGDFRRGYPQGRYPLADITFRALREGSSTLSVSVDHVRLWSDDFSEFTDITGTASGRNGIFSTGALPVETQPIVTFTQNTLAPGSYSSDLDPTTVATTATTTAQTSATPSAVATAAATLVPEVVYTAEVVTSAPSAEPTPSPDYGTYAPVTTRAQSSGVPIPIVAGIAIGAVVLMGAAFIAGRRRP